MVSDRAGSAAASGCGSSSLASHFTRREYRRPVVVAPQKETQEEAQEPPPSPPAAPQALLEGAATAPADGGQEKQPQPKGKKAKTKAKAKARAATPQLAPETEALLRTDENRRKFQVLTRLTSKLQDKRKTFSFGFEVGDEPEAPAGGAAGKGEEEEDEIDRLVRELGGEAAGAKTKSGKEKKKQQAKQEQSAAAAANAPTSPPPIVPDADKRAAAEHQQPQKEPAPQASPASTDPPAETRKEDQPTADDLSPPAAAAAAAAAAAEAMATPERKIPLGPPPGLAKPLPPPPGLPAPEKKGSGATPHQRQERRGGNGKWVQGPPAASTRKGREQPPLVQFQSWRDSSLSEEERLRKRLGQGIRNVEAIQRRSQQQQQHRAVGVIGGEDSSIWTPDRAKGPADAAALDAVTTAFSFGFAI